MEEEEEETRGRGLAVETVGTEEESALKMEATLEMNM